MLNIVSAASIFLITNLEQRIQARSVSEGSNVGSFNLTRASPAFEGPVADFFSLVLMDGRHALTIATTDLFSPCRACAWRRRSRTGSPHIDPLARPQLPGRDG